MFLFRILSDVLHLFYPRFCPGCEEPLLRGERYFCLDCSLDLPFTHFHDEPDNEVEKRLWGRVTVHAATSLFYFVPGGKVQRGLHSLKYKGNRMIGVGFGRMLGSELARSKRFSTVDAVLHVPLHPRKKHKRGFDQSACIAEGIAREMDIPHFSGVLERTDHSSTQTDKARFERWKNVEGLFTIHSQKGLQGKHVLLIDDVITTGSTLEACIHPLKEGLGEDGRISIATIACA